MYRDTPAGELLESLVEPGETEIHLPRWVPVHLVFCGHLRVGGCMMLGVVSMERLSDVWYPSIWDATQLGSV